MRKDQSQSTEPKGKYRVTNWPEYNAGLICRGDITLWIDPDVFQAPAGKPNPKGGHPFVYADPLIQMLLTLKQMWRLPLRALQGFAQSLSKLAYPDLRVPNYTTLSRRAQSLHVVLPRLRSGAPMHLVVDSTGLKVYGEGEWKVRMHGYSKRRTWRKVHLAMDANTGMVQAVLMSSADIDDASVLLDLLAQIPPEIVIETVGADGAYDTKKCHELIEERGATPSIHPAREPFIGHKPRLAQSGVMLP